MKKKKEDEPFGSLAGSSLVLQRNFFVGLTVLLVAEQHERYVADFSASVTLYECP